MTNSAVRPFGVVIPAAGQGTRLGFATPKAFVPLKGKTLLRRCLENVLASPGVARVVVVVAPEMWEQAEEELQQLADERLLLALGGAERANSVANGVSALLAAEPELATVLVHDAARCLTPPELFAAVAQAVQAGNPAVVPALAVTDTIKQVDPAAGVEQVVATPARSSLRAVQTPQGFAVAALQETYSQIAAVLLDDPASLTDEAAMCEAAGFPVVCIPGAEQALKITKPHDLLLAEQLLQQGAATMSVPNLRVGIGTDAHQIEPGKSCALGCIDFPEADGCEGHSDGDVLAHAIVDAVLAACGLGDLGSFVGVDRPEYRGVTGTRLLQEVASFIAQEGFQIVNVSAQLIGQTPKFGPRRAEAQAACSAALGAPVALSATTTDHMGFTGRGEGRAAVATALVSAH